VGSLVDVTPAGWTVTGTPSGRTGVMAEKQIVTDYTLDAVTGARAAPTS
jgi:hypothetical protein